MFHSLNFQMEKSIKSIVQILHSVFLLLLKVENTNKYYKKLLTKP